MGRKALLLGGQTALAAPASARFSRAEGDAQHGLGRWRMDGRSKSWVQRSGRAGQPARERYSFPVVEGCHRRWVRVCKAGLAGRVTAGANKSVVHFLGLLQCSPSQTCLIGLKHNASRDCR